MLHFLTIFVCFNKLHKLPLGIMHKHFLKKANFHEDVYFVFPQTRNQLDHPWLKKYNNPKIEKVHQGKVKPAT